MSTHPPCVLPHTVSAERRGELLIRAILLACVVIASVIPYLTHLGFYSDDWAFLLTFHNAHNQTIKGYFEAISADPSFRNRPGQALLLACAYRLSGLRPIGYHLTNAAIFTLEILLFFVALREVGLPKETTLSIPLVYAFLPHYATDRFWMAAFQANLSMVFCFLAFFAGLKTLRSSGPAKLLWKFICISSVAASLLSYETTTGLFLALPLLLYIRSKAIRRSDDDEESSLNSRWFPVVVLLTFVCIVFYKALTRTHFISHPHFLRHTTAAFEHGLWEMVNFNFVRYGAGLPSVLAKVFSHHSRISVLLLSGLIGVAILFYLGFGQCQRPLSPRSSLQLVGVGLLIWGLGYLLFVQFYQSDFTTTGIDNRVCNASAVGTAFVITGLASLGSSIPFTTRIRASMFNGIITFVCVSGFLVISTIGEFWISAYQWQQEITSDIRAHVPRLPTGSTFILDGTCRYVGPGVVFEAPWDLQGELAILYNDSSIKADVVGPTLRVEQHGLTTTIYSDVSFYPYSRDLLIYDYRKKTLKILPDLQAGQQYFKSFIQDDSCPPGREGVGTPIF